MAERAGSSSRSRRGWCDAVVYVGYRDCPKQPPRNSHAFVTFSVSPDCHRSYRDGSLYGAQEPQHSRGRDQPAEAAADPKTAQPSTLTGTAGRTGCHRRSIARSGRAQGRCRVRTNELSKISRIAVGSNGTVSPFGVEAEHRAVRTFGAQRFDSGSSCCFQVVDVLGRDAFFSAMISAFSVQRTMSVNWSSPWRTSGPSGSLEMISGRTTWSPGCRTWRA